MAEETKLSRRSFFRLAGGGIAAAIVAPKVLLDKIIDIPVEYGWTWYVDKTKIPEYSNFSELIIETLKKNSHLIADNVATNNPLLVKLKSGDKAQLRITKIPPEEQTKRMAERMEQRQKKKDAERIEHKMKHGGRLYPVTPVETSPFYEGYEDLEKKYLEKPYGLSVPHIRI